MDFDIALIEFLAKLQMKLLLRIKYQRLDRQGYIPEDPSDGWVTSSHHEYEMWTLRHLGHKGLADA
jgi:hypothetical protein